MSMGYKDILRQVGWPTDILVIDFEAYWDQDYTLAKQEWSTIEYVISDKFEATGLGARGTGRTIFFKPDSIIENLDRLKKNFGDHLEGLVVVMQYAFFDALVLKHHYNLVPKYILDTKQLSSFLEARGPHNLRDMAEEYGLPAKGDTNQFKGLHWVDMTIEQRDELDNYCCNDVEITETLMQKMLPSITNPELELPLMNHTTQLFLQKNFRFDFELAEELKKEMGEQADKVSKELGHTRDEISGNISFLALMEEALPSGESVPMKQGKKGLIPAFAKDDEGMKALLDHSNTGVRKLAEARQAVKSWPLHIKRVKNMANQSKASGGYFRVPLKYAGAHCVPGDTEILTDHGWVRIDQWHRYQKIAQWEPGGTVKFKFAGLYSEDIDETVCYCDNGTIEGTFTKGHTIPYFTKKGNFTTCQAGSLQQCQNVPLTGRFTADRYQPEFQTRLLVAVQADGHWQLSTRSSRCLRFGFKKAKKISRMKWLLRQLRIPFTVALEKIGAHRFKIRWADLPDWLKPEFKVFGPWLLSHDPEVLFDELIYWDGHVDGAGSCYSSTIKLNVEWVQILGHLSNRRVSIKEQPQQNENWKPLYKVYVSSKELTSSIRKRHWRTEQYRGKVYCPKTDTGFWFARFNNRVVITGNTHRWSGCEGVNAQNFGSKAAPLIVKVRNLLLADEGMVLVTADSRAIEARGLSWIANQVDLTEAFGRNLDVYSEFASNLLGRPVRKPEKYDPKPVAKILKIGRDYGKQYILGCGYGMGATRMLAEMRKIPAFAEKIEKGEITLATCKRDIKFYRQTYPMVPKFWGDVEKAFKVVTKYTDQVRTVGPLVFYSKGSIVYLRLPSGRELRYQHCRVQRGDNSIRWKYGKLWGGGITENIVQSMCRDLLGFWILECEKAGLPVVIHVHDDLTIMVSKEKQEESWVLLGKIMLTKPTWAEGFPLAIDPPHIGDRYEKG